MPAVATLPMLALDVPRNGGGLQITNLMEREDAGQIADQDFCPAVAFKPITVAGRLQYTPTCQVIARDAMKTFHGITFGN